MYYDSFMELVKYLNNLGWHSGEKHLIRFDMFGQFEGYRGRASETWEQRYEIEIEEIPELGIPHVKKSGLDLNKMCTEIIKEINAEVKKKNDSKKGYKGEF